MSLFRGKGFGLFGRHSLATSHQLTRQESSAPEPGENAAKPWYRATSPDGSVRQIVLHMTPETVTETKFGLLIFGSNSPVLTLANWCAGFSRISEQNVLVFRSVTFAEEIRKAGITVALSFCHMPSHSIVIVNVRVETTALTERVRRAFPTLPPVDKPIAEWISGLAPYDRDIIPATLNSNPLRVVVADDSSSQSSVLQPDGSFRSSPMPQAVFEFQFDFGPEARQAMKDEWSALLKYDATIPSFRRNFPKANGVEVCKVLPLDRDPVFAPPR